jgi:hypothetical protein
MFEKALIPISVPVKQPIAPVIQPSKIESVEVPKSFLPPSKPAKKS